MKTLSDKAGGNAAVFYENFSREAADQSARIVLRMLNIINWCGRYCFLSKITIFLD
jgi:nucleoside phosphorylase